MWSARSHKLLVLCIALLLSGPTLAQDTTATADQKPVERTLSSKLSFQGDFRFRIEQDWNSRKPNGQYRDDRTRTRIRFRFGLRYDVTKQMFVVGRVRTGYANNPQDPQITLGSGAVAFDNLPIMLDQAAFHYHGKQGWFWVGKDELPFVHYTELFWSENVTPNGMAAGLRFRREKKFKVDLSGGYFVGLASGGNLGKDAYLAAGQATFSNERRNCALAIPIAFYAFQNFPLYPGTGSELLDRHILQPTVSWRSKKVPFRIAVETYFNLTEASVQDSILKDFSNELFGWDVMISYGDLKEKGDFLVQVTYAVLQQFSNVDYLAQNDWARWSYGAVGSPAGRLSNFRGAEIVVGWRWHKNARLKMKYYPMHQLKAYGSHLETNQRVRLDLDVNF